MALVNRRIVFHVAKRHCFQNHFESSKNIVSPYNRRLLSNNTANSFKDSTSSRLNIKTIAAVLVLPAAYAAYEYSQRKKVQLNYKEPDVITIDRLPKVPISYKIVNANDKTDLDLILFRCQTCPFCCKMIAYLNSRGLSYSVVNVDEPFERSMKWSHHKQVPCVLARTKQGKYIELTNSTVIISILAAISHDPEIDIEDLAKLYPKMSYIEENGHHKYGIVNKYELMYKGKLPKGVTEDSMQ